MEEFGIFLSVIAVIVSFAAVVITSGWLPAIGITVVMVIAFLAVVAFTC